MAVGIALAIALFAGQAGSSTAQPAYGPALPSPPKPQAKSADGSCAPPPPTAGTAEIVVCAQRPEGYRLNRDVMEAHREKHGAGRPTPRETMKDNSCATVGPMGCRGMAGINVLAAASTAAEMAARLSRGEEIGSMFVTDPHPTEYQLYVAAKKRREAIEAEAAAKAKAKTTSPATAGP